MANESIIAYFDILGYQAFLKSNSAIDTAERIFEIIQEAPEQAISKMRTVSLPSQDRWHECLGKIKTLIFSDTILVSLPFEAGEDFEVDHAIVCSIASSISLEMFNSGLPVRGVVTRGQFMFKGTCIAGTAVVEAFNLSNQLEFSGVVLSQEFSDYVESRWSKNRKFWDLLYPYYLCPLKNGSQIQFRSIPLILHHPNGNELAVREAFWKWGKNIPIEVDQKVFNTVKMLDFFRVFRSKEPLEKYLETL